MAGSVTLSSLSFAPGSLSSLPTLPMSIEIMSQVWKTPCPTHTLKLVLLALADNSNDQRVCWPSIIYLAKKCDLTDQSIIDQIQRLEKEGLIGVERQPGRANRYTILPLNSGSNPSTGFTGQAQPTRQPGLRVTRKPGLRDPSTGLGGPVNPVEWNLKEPKENLKTTGPVGPEQLGDKPKAPLRQLTDTFVASYREQFHEPYVFTAADGVGAAKLLKAGIGIDIIIKTARRAWKHLDLFWCKQSATLRGLAGAWPNIRAELKTLDGPSAEERLADSWGKPL